MYQCIFPNTHSSPRKTPAPKKAEKKESQSASEEKVKMRVITQPKPTNPTLPINQTLAAEPNPTVVNTTATTLTLLAKSATTSIPVTVYNLAQGKFEGIPYPLRKFQEGEGPSAPSCNNPQGEQKPEAAAAVTISHGLIPCFHKPV